MAIKLVTLTNLRAHYKAFDVGVILGIGLPLLSETGYQDKWTLV